MKINKELEKKRKVIMNARIKVLSDQIEKSKKDRIRIGKLKSVNIKNK